SRLLAIVGSGVCVAFKPAFWSTARGVVIVLCVRVAGDFPPRAINRTDEDDIGLSGGRGSGLRARVAAVAHRHAAHRRHVKSAVPDGGGKTTDSSRSGITRSGKN